MGDGTSQEPYPSYSNSDALADTIDIVGNTAAAIQAMSGVGIITAIRTQQIKRWAVGKLRPRTVTRIKAVNLPAWKNVGIDTEHIMAGHTASGAMSAGRTLFPDYMSQRGIERAVRGAYQYGKRIETQGDRVLVRGQAEGLTIDMWVNTVTEMIETAYPVF